ncbi:flagellar assembly peptidoglycan hydrolase FlgJ [Shewanella sp. 202IG2-18]|uniref:flagellar assembly peptidoglycan hydrolase FlgJ n=1 Tax=Parashewanella hymeniacidonis TaxID=2807618 RepID=UPI0019612C7D|nr:flagellar assembly peptidoglycan hydrolase FlgJ [Parashewanella hymeniacidonis]MBM7073050.1 flagellar assembly peptidoglycan hydrolase FlgJ [Parashewanella hymeniacidonis]
MEKLANASNFLELGGLDQLRSQAQKDEKGALKEVAKQFEGIFVQMLMKSMRDANEVFKSDSPFNTQYTAFYEQMRDQQLSIDLSDKGTLGIADLMVKQLSPETSKIKPASTLRNDGQLPVGDDLLTQKALPSHIKINAVQNSVDKNLITISDVVSGKITPTEAKQGFADKADFINQLYPYAQKAADKLGTQPEVLIAQSALETGWGQKVVRQPNGETSNNLFNIKATNAWEGNKAKVSTLEFEQGIAVKQQADFRVYDDIKQSFDDFVNFLSSGKRYQDALKAAKEPEQFINGLQKAGYATDPNYTQKVMSVLKSVVAGK